MNTEEAKFLLSCMRPNNRDAGDPRFAEAIKLLETDPELKKWFEEQQGFDQALCDKLSELDSLPVLAELDVEQNRFKKFESFRSVLTLIAVAVVVLANVVAVLSPSNNGNSQSNFRQAVLKEIQQLQSLDYSATDVEAIRAWLKVNSVNVEFKTPNGMGKLGTAGCHLFEWEGNKASLICFKTGSGDAESMAHLVVVKGDLFPTLDEKSLKVESREGWSTVVWLENSQTYLLASKGDPAELRRLLGSG